ncbi:hypothetical protein NXV12_21315 [Bacteroides thetaiotaomicron]|nr:hypothetical protein [Bacteroides thetaiotaomicron]
MRDSRPYVLFLVDYLGRKRYALPVACEHKSLCCAHPQALVDNDTFIGSVYLV